MRSGQAILFSIFIFTGPLCLGQNAPADTDVKPFVRPEVAEPILDALTINSLKPFNDDEDAIIYIYRLSSMVGAAVKWKIQIDEIVLDDFRQKEFAVVHINGTKDHRIVYPSVNSTFVDFKPHKYYTLKLKGFGSFTGYLDAAGWNEIKKCKRERAVTK